MPYPEFSGQRNEPLLADRQIPPQTQTIRKDGLGIQSVSLEGLSPHMQNLIRHDNRERVGLLLEAGQSGSRRSSASTIVSSELEDYVDDEE